MRDLFASGRAVDIVLVVMLVEFAVLVVRRAPDQRTATAIDLGFALAPGACILLGLRAALVGASWPWIALWLLASFPLHISDLLRRRV